MLDHEFSRPAAPVGESTASAPPHPRRSARAPALRIGLLNNMPDAAFTQTEGQFRRLLGPAVSLALFAFRDESRGPAVRSRIEASYAPHEALADAGLDALIVTGCEPKRDRLEDESYYAPLSAVIDWAVQSTASTLFSCLAAHAAVQHLHGIRRRPLPLKLSGVFPCAAAVAHPLLAGMPATVPVPHSRWNDLNEDALVEEGYVVLRRSGEIGVDLFIRDEGSLLVFLQGHPEYDADGLAREYRRDLGRFLEGTVAACPRVPRHYFPRATEAALEGFASAPPVRLEARASILAGIDAASPRRAAWRPAAADLLRNWLTCVALRREPRAMPLLV